jgi:Ca2+-binding RTX toxin-like protein
MSDQLGGGGSGDILKGWSNAATNDASDTFTGGAGADTFVFAEALDTNNAYGNGNSKSPIAVITDFQAGNGRDVLQLKNFGAADGDYSLTFTSPPSVGSVGTLTRSGDLTEIARITISEGTLVDINSILTGNAVYV